MALGAGVKNASWSASLEDYREALRNAKQRGALTLLGAKVESGLEYFKSWRDLPSFEFNEVENVYRFMRHIEKIEGKRVVPLPGPRH
jgi:hypothetical protein